MTNRSVNFSFLADIAPDLGLLHCFAHQAEKYLHSDPNSCLIKIRQFGELLAQEIAARNGESIDRGESQEILLRRLSMNGILKQNSSDLFHQIRKEGNRANHHGLSDYNRALRVLKYSHQLACWFYHTYVNQCSLSTFVLPPDPAIETAQLLSVFSQTQPITESLVITYEKS